ncbi:hypothetical protein SARC_10058 [Sphaeroforma arctica JP610]|uniref:Uncharacterized protein n=1 Tax=Sphaeroforma arctica JP610 TaxID=667725 RepID=A0A0L0FL36_9EUKA|nr:hypothetical protein SARC_10058 [Sphaeroforma arctica JP610]KNC77480.1 hypothetical protein SARC_10058 [Sphaeroforma arctica JP610]|eukprot:XP_014151382.1 hypothetical protein SARC_10058 [Sphaeroforma arctica JP610]
MDQGLIAEQSIFYDMVHQSGSASTLIKDANSAREKRLKTAQAKDEGMGANRMWSIIENSTIESR